MRTKGGLVQDTNGRWRGKDGKFAEGPPEQGFYERGWEKSKDIEHFGDPVIRALMRGQP